MALLAVANKEMWLGGMVATWTAVVETLAIVVAKYSQTVYAGFLNCLQNEWQHQQCMVADIEPFFALLEQVIGRSSSSPSLEFNHERLMVVTVNS